MFPGKLIFVDSSVTGVLQSLSGKKLRDGVSSNEIRPAKRRCVFVEYLYSRPVAYAEIPPLSS